MLKKTLLVASLLILSAFTDNIQKTTTASTLNKNADLIDAKNWLSYLTDDKRLGRKTGSKQMLEVQKWLIDQYKSIGLQPLPKSNSFLQAFTIKSKNDDILDAANVIGYIDCRCDNEKAIIIGAHYDHIGVSTKPAEDIIFNGADDDASGVVLSLLIAKHLVNKTLPFNIIVAAWDGEELGLKGSKHFVKKPLFPLEHIEVGMMFELVGVPPKGKTNTAWMTGSQYSTLFPILKKSLKMQQWELTENPFPEMGLFMRSDNAPFALIDLDQQKAMKVFKKQEKVSVKGIPAHAFSVWGGGKHYHSVKDEIAIIDIENLTSLAKTFAQTLANLPSYTRIEWNENPEFDFSRPE